MDIPIGIREKAGETDGRQAVKVGRARAQGYQGEHVEAAIPNGRPGPLPEGEPAPNHYGSRQEQLDPLAEIRSQDPGDRLSGRHIQHGQQEEGNRETEPPAKTPGHFTQFPAVSRSCSVRLQGHAA